MNAKAQRNAAIIRGVVTEKRPLIDVAHEHSISTTRVQQILARYRKRVEAGEEQGKYGYGIQVRPKPWSRGREV